MYRVVFAIAVLLRSILLPQEHAPVRHNLPMKRCFLFFLATVSVFAQTSSVLLRPARVFDGEAVHEGWAVRVNRGRIEAAGLASGIASDGARVIELPGATLMPGLVEGHSHIMLHPYNEATWDDQVSREGLAL